MQVSETGIELIKHFEGLRLDAYQDVAGIWTIGYGHTGPDVEPGQVITEAEAEALLRQDLDRFERGVSDAVRVDIDQNQFDALVSLAYNIGVSAFRSSTALKRLNRGDFLGAAEAMTWWNKATINGVRREVLGLVRRRAAEAALFLEDLTTTGDSDETEDSSRVQPEENSPRRGNVLGSRTVEGAVVAGAGGVAGAGAAMMGGDDDDESGTEPADPPVEDLSDPPAEEPPTEEPPVEEPPVEEPSDPVEDSVEDPVEEPADPPTEEPADPPAEEPVEEPADPVEDTTETIEQPPAGEGEISRTDYTEAFQVVAGVIVVLAVLYIIFARVDDWLKFRR